MKINALVHPFTAIVLLYCDILYYNMTLNYIKDNDVTGKTEKQNLNTDFIGIVACESDPKFTPERRSGIIDAIAHQIPANIAAEANGIDSGRLCIWLQTALEHHEEDRESDYTKFLTDFRRAEMQCIRAHIDILCARPDNWEAHAWLLERRWHEDYGIV